MKMFRCSGCGEPINVPYGRCKTCCDKDWYGNERKFDKSVSTKQRFDKFGNPICIICGAITKCLNKHLPIHNMNVFEYRKKYNIPKDIKLTNYKIKK